MMHLSVRDTGDITQKGYDKKRAKLLAPYQTRGKACTTCTSTVSDFSLLYEPINKNYTYLLVF